MAVDCGHKFRNTQGSLCKTLGAVVIILYCSGQWVDFSKTQGLLRKMCTMKGYYQTSAARSKVEDTDYIWRHPNWYATQDLGSRSNAPCFMKAGPNPGTDRSPNGSDLIRRDEIPSLQSQINGPVSEYAKGYACSNLDLPIEDRRPPRLSLPWPD